MKGKNFISNAMILGWLLMLSSISISAGADGFDAKSYGHSHSSQANGRKVVGYFTEWSVYGRNYHVKNIHDSGSAAQMTHLMYAFGAVQGGRCQVADSYADYEKFYDAQSSVDGVADIEGGLRGNFGQLKRLKQMYPKLKVLWSFGGWSGSAGFSEAVQDPAAFADSCFQLVYDPRWDGVFDGIDIDWEYPNDCGQVCDQSGFDAYRELMEAMRKRFGKKRLVTAAISANEAKLNVADYAGASRYVDFYMLMSYDFFGTWDGNGPTAPHSPLYSYDGIPVTTFTTDHAVQVLKNKGIPAKKILLGLGFYGRGWTGVTVPWVGGGATGPAAGQYEAGVNDYKVLKDICPASGTVGGTAFAYCDGDWWGYDTPATIYGKMRYARRQGLGGAFFWELSGDTTEGELIQAISQGLKPQRKYHLD